MWTFTEEHQIILERLHLSAISAGRVWDEHRKNELRDLWGSGYIDMVNGHWCITIKGTARRIDYRNQHPAEQEQS